MVASPPLFIIPIRPFRDTLKFRKREEEPQANPTEPNFAPRRGKTVQGRRPRNDNDNFCNSLDDTTAAVRHIRRMEEVASARFDGTRSQERTNRTGLRGTVGRSPTARAEGRRAQDSQRRRIEERAVPPPRQSQRPRSGEEKGLRGVNPSLPPLSSGLHRPPYTSGLYRMQSG